MKNFTLLSLLFLSSLSFAQTKLHVIKASSKKVSIKDGDEFSKNSWSLSPIARPDIYTAERTRKTKWVTFYTDIDSIKVKVKPGMRYNFVILFNGKDSCYTQIASGVPPEDRSSRRGTAIDTIPFTMTAYNAIAFKAVVNGTDSVDLHFDTGSWDFRLTKDAIVKKTKLLFGQNGPTPNFSKLNKVSKLQIGKLVINDPDFSATDMTAQDMDGRFGWNLFEGK